MNRDEARQIAMKANQLKRAASPQEHSVDRSLPDFLSGKASADARQALATIERAASAGFLKCFVHVQQSARPPMPNTFAWVNGEAAGVAELLREKGFDVRVPEPYLTHDYDGYNGVALMLEISWQ